MMLFNVADILLIKQHIHILSILLTIVFFYSKVEFRICLFNCQEYLTIITVIGFVFHFFHDLNAFR